MNCPICGSAAPKSELHTWKDPVGGEYYTLLRCRGCGTVFADPFRAPGAAWYEKFSTADSYTSANPDRFLSFLRMARLEPGSSVLDLGCGNGAFMRLAAARGLDAHGLDINPNAIAAAKAAGLSQVFEGTFAELMESEPGRRYDAVTMFDYFEHLDAPLESLRLAAKALRSGGLLFVNTPNEDRPMPFGRDDFDQPPHHLTRWTAASLSACLEANGFSVEKVESGYLPVREFSRRLVNLVTGLALAAARALRLVRRPGQVPAAGPGGAKAAVINTRRRLVRIFQEALYIAAFPFFLPLALYFKFTRKGAGIHLSVLARKREPGAR